MRLSLMALVSALATLAWAAPFTDELDVDRYDVQCSLTCARPTGGVTIELERSAGAPGIRVRVEGGQVRLAGQMPVPMRIPVGGTGSLVLARLGGWLLVDAGTGPVVAWTVPRGPGAEGVVTADGGWTVGETRVSRLEPVCFGDNFMRTGDDAGQWRVGAGTWRLQSAWDNDPRMKEKRYANAGHSTNPFAWVGVGSPAVCTTGLPTWEEYECRVAVRPAADGAVGVLCNLTDADNGLLVRWAVANGGNALTLERWEGGKRGAVLGTTRLGYIPDRWYEIVVTSTYEGIRVAVDGDVRLTKTVERPWRGGIGLYAEGSRPSIFDDVTVYGEGIRTDLLREARADEIGAAFLRGTMREWAARNEWAYAPPGQVRRHVLDYYGDPAMAARVTPRAGVGELRLLLCGTPGDANAGYRAVIRATDDPPRVEAIIAQGDAWLANGKTDAVEPGEPVTWRFRRQGGLLILERDGTEVLRARPRGPVAGARPGYLATGCFVGASVRVTSTQTIDDIFAESPTAWRGVGTWQSTTRWSCSSEWSFLGGWSRGDAALWHKQRFTGDQFFEAFVGVKMEVPGEHQGYEQRLRDLCVTICGDGEDPRVGYALVFGAMSADGTTPNSRTVLMRRGVVVGEAPDVIPPREVQHFEWFGLGLRKEGATVTASLNGRPIITFTDPDPIAGGVPAIWTRDSGLVVARARLHHANPPAPCAATPVVLPEPGLPPWGTVGRELALDFADAWSASGTPVRLAVEPRVMPPDAAQPAVDGMVVRWTPAKAGEYWFSVVATDGERRSAPFHVSLRVFDLARGRDDSRAVALYRFDEDEGATVRDRSAVAPALDLTLRNPADAAWRPGEGLRLGPTARLEAARADKLMALKAANAGSIELWVSNETKYPPPDKVFKGALVAWGGHEWGHNLLLGHQRASLLVCPPDARLDMGSEADLAEYSYHSGLQHLVVTWDGTTTRLYADGALLAQRGLDWQTDRWRADLPLILGGLLNDRAPELGTYHLVAVHDRCLTPEQVQRHYEAGPRGR